MTAANRFRLGVGSRWPCGAHADAEGVNFALYSRHATAVALLLFADPKAAEPSAVIRLDPKRHRTFHHWHVYVHGARPGLYYAWRVDGPNDPHTGMRFDPRRELLDPWAREVSDVRWDRRTNRSEGRTGIRARVVAPDDYEFLP